MSTPLHVVLGAGGGIGSAVVHELARRGHRTRAVQRGPALDLPPGVTTRAADVSTTEGARAACADATVVYHCAQPPYHRWPQEFPQLTDAVIEGAAAAGAKLVFADNLYLYGPIDGPVSERSPRRPTSRKGAVRKEMADRLLQAHKSGRLNVTIGQASDYYGPGGTKSVIGAAVVPAVLDGRTVNWPGRLDVPHTVHYLPDIAAALVTLGERDAADGRTFVLPAAPAPTPRQFIRQIAAAAGSRTRMRGTTKPLMRLVGLSNPAARELLDIWYQFSHPWTVDDTLYRLTFGHAEVTAPDAAVAATVAWHRTHTARPSGG
ncbi:NAD-dependent epimerase/dehydratase family protein [Streptomyces albipurpureus]|uniref:NAD-dependent epimerase/dehydratase family protein n=1 Tax=Streptomyces albipurpureus TaxID=2897419 RepID=A0ABT0UGT4_9ACTN|nr:NAD-dependent epimerase/dehydratase family protein [Streptomyces sp. CWNU-1]MCM2387644.1 NAD-dependent epimerase/dehydratase family protein [Streptomyces sp. CWNU-1]